VAGHDGLLQAPGFSRGVHDSVPLDKIADRYYRSIALYVYASALADRSYLYDNSINQKKPVLLMRNSEGAIVKTYPALSAHRWAREIESEIRQQH